MLPCGSSIEARVSSLGETTSIQAFSLSGCILLIFSRSRPPSSIAREQLATYEAEGLDNPASDSLPVLSCPYSVIFNPFVETVFSSADVYILTMCRAKREQRCPALHGVVTITLGLDVSSPNTLQCPPALFVLTRR